MGKGGAGSFGNVSAESRYGFATTGHFLLSNFSVCACVSK